MTLGETIEKLSNLRANGVPDATPVQVWDPGEGFNHGTPDGIEQMFKDEGEELWKSAEDAQAAVDQIPVDAEDDEVPVVGELTPVVAIRLFA